MSNDKIIPFGKYKGQEIEQVIARDPQYVQWIMQQAWFQEKFAPIYQVVINQFAPPSEDTPAHNAIQVRFLEHDFRCAFWNAANIRIEWQQLREWWQRKTEDLRKAPQPFARRREVRERPREWIIDLFERHRDRVKMQWNWWREAHEEPLRKLAVGKPQFETAVDVEFRVSASVGHPALSNVQHTHRLTIEIKPSMGDDYPAVLRQIKRQIMADQYIDGITYTHRLLLVDEFGSNTVTLDQVRAIFAQDNITIIMLADVREQLIKLQRGHHG